MKKRLLLVSVGLSAALLAGCSEMDINYKGELKSEDQVEEIIADELEVENPELDLEVDIYMETED